MTTHSALLCHARGLLTADETLARVMLDAAMATGEMGDPTRLHNVLTSAGYDDLARQVDNEFRRRARAAA